LAGELVLEQTSDVVQQAIGTGRVLRAAEEAEGVIETEAITATQGFFHAIGSCIDGATGLLLVQPELADELGNGLALEAGEELIEHGLSVFGSVLGSLDEGCAQGSQPDFRKSPPKVGSHKPDPKSTTGQTSSPNIPYTTLLPTAMYFRPFRDPISLLAQRASLSDPEKGLHRFQVRSAAHERQHGLTITPGGNGMLHTMNAFRGHMEHAIRFLGLHERAHRVVLKAQAVHDSGLHAKSGDGEVERGGQCAHGGSLLIKPPS
jgi:hypothetical protein